MPPYLAEKLDDLLDGYECFRGKPEKIRGASTAEQIAQLVQRAREQLGPESALALVVAHGCGLRCSAVTQCTFSVSWRRRCSFGLRTGATTSLSTNARCQVLTAQRSRSATGSMLRHRLLRTQVSPCQRRWHAQKRRTSRQSARALTHASKSSRHRPIARIAPTHRPNAAKPRTPQPANLQASGMKNWGCPSKRGSFETSFFLLFLSASLLL